MQPCAQSCSISFIFIIAMIYFYNAIKENQVIKNYRATLSPSLQKRYDKICRERRSISLQGYVLGVVLAIGIIYYDVYVQKQKMNNPTLICIVVATCFFTNYFYYILHPKTDWLLNHLETKNQNVEWLKMYKVMQFHYHIGFVFGIVAIGIFAFAFRK